LDVGCPKSHPAQRAKKEKPLNGFAEKLEEIFLL
jgi:hypothetical protein